ncbi:ester cyclase [Variovorax rhizosphaerae]|uniref:Ester cyclase n=1 Tax=Variovorax rhizosphaerae TaxID=1836200 RepID=A0ABU8WX01_9BURK
MTAKQLTRIYLDYISCLNSQNWASLGRYVHDQASHNGRQLGLAGYREMLEKDFQEIPDLFFDVQLLVAEPPRIASRLQFNCAPRGEFLGLPVNGRQVSFTENVLYEFEEVKICRVWSVIDKLAIEKQF